MPPATLKRHHETPNPDGQGVHPDFESALPANTSLNGSPGTLRRPGLQSRSSTILEQRAVFCSRHGGNRCDTSDYVVTHYWYEYEVKGYLGLPAAY